MINIYVRFSKNELNKNKFHENFTLISFSYNFSYSPGRGTRTVLPDRVL